MTAMFLDQGDAGPTPCSGRSCAATVISPRELRVMMDTIQPSCCRLKLSSSSRQELRPRSLIDIFSVGRKVRTIRLLDRYATSSSPFGGNAAVPCHDMQPVHRWARTRQSASNGAAPTLFQE